MFQAKFLQEKSLLVERHKIDPAQNLTGFKGVRKKC